MNSSRFLTSFALVTLVAAGASAQFTTTGAGPFNSWGYEGDPNNSHLLSSYSGTSTLFGNLAFTGTLHDVAAGAFASDSSWVVNNTTRSNSITLTPGASTTFTTTTISGNNPGLFWINHNDAFNFESAQNSDNDPSGNDAFWTNVTMAFNGTPTTHSLGNLNSATPLTFDTITSNFDTVMALYSSTGTLLRFDDDSGGNFTSKFNLGLVPGGSYYLTIGSFGTNNIYDFQNGVAVGGDDAGALVVNMNGGIVYGGTHAANTLDTFTFTIVPEPASIVALGLGAVILLRRRKR